MVAARDRAAGVGSGGWDLAKEFPIKSQTSPSDKVALLTLRTALQALPSYAYVEIGSFLGGSLTPFLRDPKCTSILSIDDRGRHQPDERGRTSDYSWVTHDTMLETLAGAGLATDKLEVFDGPVSAYPVGEARYDLLFVDGEHTDVACFRDYVYGTRLLHDRAIVAFHDSYIVWRALRIIQEHLQASGTPHQLVKVASSEISCIFLGEPPLPGRDLFEIEDDLDAFYTASDARLLMHNVRNRLSTATLARELARRARKRAPLRQVERGLRSLGK
jgi:hypothetical protein